MIESYQGKPGDQWNRPAWEELPEDLRTRFAAAIEDVYRPLPFYDLIDDIEVAGGRAIGCANDDSDIDLNAAAKDWPTQFEIWKVEKDPKVMQPFHDRLRAVMHDFKIFIDPFFRNPDSRLYVPVYRLREKKLYQRKEGEHFNYRLVWRPLIGEYGLWSRQEKVKRIVEYADSNN